MWGYYQRAKDQAYLRNGLRLEVRGGTSDLQIVDEVFIHKIYDRALDRLQPGDHVIDVGAHCGMFALAVAQAGARVSCFEPLHENFELLLQNIRRNGYCDKACAYNLALASTSGQIDLYVVDGDTGGSTRFPSIHPEWLDDGDVKSSVKKRSVRCTTLREILLSDQLPFCDCLKLDCEGMEYDILESAQTDDLRNVRMIIMEYHPNGSIDVIRTRLEEIGFRVEVSGTTRILFATMDVSP